MARFCSRRRHNCTSSGGNPIAAIAAYRCSAPAAIGFPPELVQLCLLREQNLATTVSGAQDQSHIQAQAQTSARQFLLQMYRIMYAGTVVMDLVPNAPLSERESKLSKRVKKILTFKPIQRRHLQYLEWQPGFRCACVDPRLVDGRYANALNTTGMFALDVRNP